MAMSESERKRLVLQSARLARRLYRTADTSGEVLERWLDRQIGRKTRITGSQAYQVIPRWEAYRDRVLAVEKGIADFLATAAM